MEASVWIPCHVDQRPCKDTAYVENLDKQGKRAAASREQIGRIRQAMRVALRSETKAHEFFVQAIPHLADPEVKALFQELRDEEVLHQSLVREAMRSLPLGGEPDAGDYEDEPVAQ
jgi:rubrerythrin